MRSFCAIADVDHAVLRDLDAADACGTASTGAAFGSYGPIGVVVGFSPYAPQLRLKAPVVASKTDDAAVAEAVGDVDLVGGVVDARRRRAVEAGLAVAAFGLAGLADLRQELAVLVELQDLRVGGRRRSGRRRTASTATRSLRIAAPAGGAPARRASAPGRGRVCPAAGAAPRARRRPVRRVRPSRAESASPPADPDVALAVDRDA